MKKVVDVSIASVKFSLEEEACTQLKAYLSRFEASLEDKLEAKEVMEDVEARIAEIFQKTQSFPQQVIDKEMVRQVIEQLGDVAPSHTADTPAGSYAKQDKHGYGLGDKKLFRDMEDKRISGVCSGIAHYFDMDVTLVRILFVALLLLWGTTGIIYIVAILIVPKAETISDRLRMKGYAVNPENINKYASEHNI